MSATEDFLKALALELDPILKARVDEIAPELADRLRRVEEDIDYNLTKVVYPGLESTDKAVKEMVLGVDTLVARANAQGEKLNTAVTDLTAAKQGLSEQGVLIASLVKRIAALEKPPVVEEPPPPPPPPPGVLIKRTQPFRSSRNGEVIENIEIEAAGDCLTITHDDVIVRNVLIKHRTGCGIVLNGADRLKGTNIKVINADPPSGINGEANPDTFVNIKVLGSPNTVWEKVTVEDGSSGMYFISSPNAQVTTLRGKNFHGGFPRGQLIQFDKSGGSRLADFDVFNDPKNSRVEDNVSVFSSPNVTIRDGVIDGNNSLTGVGIMFELGSTGGRVFDVDTLNQGNGSFSAYAPDVVFENVRDFNHHNLTRDGVKTASNGLIFAASGEASSASTGFKNARYKGNWGNVAWDQGKMHTREFIRDDSMMPKTKAPINHGF